MLSCCTEAFNLSRGQQDTRKILKRRSGPTLNTKENNQSIRGKNGSTEHSKGNNTIPEKVATTRTEDGHKENTKTNTTI